MTTILEFEVTHNYSIAIHSNNSFNADCTIISGYETLFKNASFLAGVSNKHGINNFLSKDEFKSKPVISKIITVQSDELNEIELTATSLNSYQMYSQLYKGDLYNDKSSDLNPLPENFSEFVPNIETEEFIHEKSYLLAGFGITGRLYLNEKTLKSLEEAVVKYPNSSIIIRCLINKEVSSVSISKENYPYPMLFEKFDRTEINSIKLYVENRLVNPINLQTSVLEVQNKSVIQFNSLKHEVKILRYCLFILIFLVLIALYKGL